MTRCFVAFELTEESRRYLHERVAPLHEALRARQRWPVRLVRPENWHATLLFFDDITREERNEVWAAVAEGVQRGAWRGLDFDWRGLALWPNSRRPSLVCLEAADYPGARDWPVASLLERPPFNKADVRHYEPFRPHVTVLRFDPRWRKTLARDWPELCRALPPLEPGAIAVDRIAFLLSTLSREQPIYPRERSLPLARD